MGTLVSLSRILRSALSGERRDVGDGDGDRDGRTTLTMRALLSQYDIDECAGEPCQNGATCVNEPGSFRCLCPPDKTGESRVESREWSVASRERALTDDASLQAPTAATRSLTR